MLALCSYQEHFAYAVPAPIWLQRNPAPERRITNSRHFRLSRRSDVKYVGCAGGCAQYSGLTLVISLLLLYKVQSIFPPLKPYTDRFFVKQPEKGHGGRP